MLERFEGYINEDELEMLEIYIHNDEEDWNWVKYSVEDAEDVYMVEEVIKEIYKQVKADDEEYRIDNDDETYYNLHLGHQHELGLKRDNKTREMLGVMLGF